MINSKIKIVRRETACDMSEVNIFPNGYISKISGENHIMEKIINLVLQSEEIPKELKNKIVRGCGEDCFQKINEDGSYVWRGL